MFYQILTSRKKELIYEFLLKMVLHMPISVSLDNAEQLSIEWKSSGKVAWNPSISMIPLKTLNKNNTQSEHIQTPVSNKG